MKGMNRRSFLHRSARAVAGGAACSFPAGVFGKEGGSPTPKPCSPGAWRKHGVVLEPTEDWEGGTLQNFTCPAEPLEDGRWRLWYSSHGRDYKFNIAYAEGVPGRPFRKVRARLTPGEPGEGGFVIGNLPSGWNPVQVVHIHLKNGRHRIYFWAHGPNIGRYLAAESDDGKRYTVVDPLRPVLWHPNDRAAHGVPSPDGVMLRAQPSNRPAGEPPAESRLISNDATCVYQLDDGTFEMYSVGLVRVPEGDPAYVAADNAPGLLRVIDRYTSADGLRFETRQRVIERDADEPADQQFYYLAVTHTPRGRVGMLGHYRVRAQTMDLEWCFSADGVKWERPLRKAWLPRGDRSQADSYGIYAPNRLVWHDGKWHLFYHGVNTAHNFKDSHGPPRSVVLYATTESIWG